MAAVLTVLIQFVLYPFLEVLNTPPQIIEQSYRYISTITLFIVVMFAYNLCAGLLRAIGNSLMPLLSSVIELTGKILFVVFLIPRFEYMAVIFCEPVIRCFMVAELLIAFWTDPFVRSKEEMPQVSA